MEKDMPDIGVVRDLPNRVRGETSRSKLTQELIEAINDGDGHYIEGVDRKDKLSWGRKIRYAAKLADRDVKTVHIPEDVESDDPPGFYFRGYEKGKAPRKHKV